MSMGGMLTPDQWDGVSVNTYSTIRTANPSYATLSGTFYSLLDPKVEVSVSVTDSDQRSLVDEDTTITVIEDEIPFIDIFEVVFNRSERSPGFDITVDGLQESSVNFSRVEVIRRDPTGRLPDVRVRGLADMLVTDNRVTATDYEAPIETVLEYWLQLQSEDGVFSFGPRHPYPQPYIPTVTDAYGGGGAYLKVVDDPLRSVPLMIEDLSEWTQDGRVTGEFDVLGRRNAVVMTDVLSGREGSLTGFSFTDDGQSIDDVESALAPGSTLLLQNNNREMSAFPDIYIKVRRLRCRRVTEMVWNGRLDNPPRPRVGVRFELDYIEVDRPDPAGATVVDATWNAVYTTYKSWGEVLDLNQTFRDVLNNPYGPGG